MNWRKVESLTTEEIQEACKKAKCFRQTNGILKIHLDWIGELVDRVKREGIDVSHFNKGNVKCSKCGKPYKVMTILDFDNVGRKVGNCADCKHSEWVEDGGDIIDSFQYFTEGYKTHTMNVIGHTNI